MSLLVFGKTGQVATELSRLVPDAVFLGRDQADLTDPAACADAIRNHAPKVVINAAAYIAVDRAEEEEDLAHQINAIASAPMAHACAELGVPFVYISTDYVFESTGTEPRAVSAPVAPQNAYGRSKLAGEQAIAQAGGTFVILHTSWVFWAHGANFVKTMLRLSESCDARNIVDDQIGGPTAAADIAAACLGIAESLKSDCAESGLYHFSSAPDVSWKILPKRSLNCLVVRSLSAESQRPTIQHPRPGHRTRDWIAPKQRQFLALNGPTGAPVLRRF